MLRVGGAWNYSGAVASRSRLLNIGLSPFVENIIPSADCSMAPGEYRYSSVTDAYDFTVGTANGNSIGFFSRTMNRAPHFDDWLNLSRCVLSALRDLYLVRRAPRAGSLNFASFRLRKFDEFDALSPLPQSVHDAGWMCKLYLGSGLQFLDRGGTDLQAWQEEKAELKGILATNLEEVHSLLSQHL